jgi:hypothetical protein
MPSAPRERGLAITAAVVAAYAVATVVADLSPGERDFAAGHHDVPVP